jgi:hypothetical protein
MTVLSAPPRLGGREQARRLAAELPDDIARLDVQIDHVHVRAVTPSFVDELVKVLLVERSARRLTLLNASDDVRRYASHSAMAHGVQNKLFFGAS